MSPRSLTANARMKEASSTAILDAAEAVFAAQGFHGATTAAVAEQAGVSKGLVFNYFKTKDELLKALIEQRVSERLAFWRNLRLSGPPRAQLQHVLDRALDSVLDNPDAHRLYLYLFLQPGAARPVQAAVDALKPALAEYFSMLERLFKQLGSASPHADALLFQAALNGLAQLILVQPAVATKRKMFPLKQLKARLLEAFV